jgi:hypothetical protein
VALREILSSTPKALREILRRLGVRLLHSASLREAYGTERK